MRANGQAQRQPLALFCNARLGIARPRSIDLLYCDARNAELPTEPVGAVEIVIAERFLMRSARVSYGKHTQMHHESCSGAGISASAGSLRLLDAPHAFEVVIVADLRSEHVHDHVASID